MRSRALILIVTSAVSVAGLVPVGARAHRAALMVGAATADMTPAPFNPARHTPSMDPPGFDGPRRWDLTEPYVDLNGNGRWDPGEPYADLNHNLRYDGIYLAGGGREPKPPTRIADPITARAFVVDNGYKRIVVEVLDTIGTFADDLEQIRNLVRAKLGARALDEIFISSTHNESAPDVIGLWGPGATPAGNGILNAGVDDYWMSYANRRAAEAIIAAYRARRPARIRFAVAQQPANFLTCWSSYPYVRMSKIPVMQAEGKDGRVIFTLMNYGIHAESLSFNGEPVTAQKYWLSADWPYWARRALQARFGGVAIQMASMVGSVETPKVFRGSVSARPTGQYDAGHPAGCRTIFATTGRPVQIGYFDETRAVGEGAADAVIAALDSSAQPSRSNEIRFVRRSFYVPLTNTLFVAAGAGQVFPHRPFYLDGVELPETSQFAADPAGTANSMRAVDPNSGGMQVRTQIVGYQIGDGEFVSNPGEGFPISEIRGFQGPSDMPYPNDPMTAFVSPHFSAPYHFVEGLGEDMIGYLFPKANAVGIPGDRPADLITHSVSSGGSDPFGGFDRFGCEHSDDSEAVSGDAGNIVAQQSIAVLGALGRSPDHVLVGRWIWPDGSLHRDPLGEGTLGCTSKTRAFKLAPGSPIGVVVLDGGKTRRIAIGKGRADFIDYDGFNQGLTPTIDTRGVRLPDGTRIFLDVYPNATFAKT